MIKPFLAPHNREPWWAFLEKYQRHYARTPTYEDFNAGKFEWINDQPPQSYLDELAEQTAEYMNTAST